MATLKQRLWRKNASGTYDTIHQETESGMILRPSGRTVEADLAAYLPEYQDSDDVPKSLKDGKILVCNSKVYAGKNKLDLTKDTIYTHPSTKQCTGGNCATVNGYTITAQTTDPGVGSSLASGRIVLVYE